MLERGVTLVEIEFPLQYAEQSRKRLSECTLLFELDDASKESTYCTHLNGEVWQS